MSISNIYSLKLNNLDVVKWNKMRTIHISFLSLHRKLIEHSELSLKHLDLLYCQLIFSYSHHLTLKICCCVIKVSKNVSACLSLTLGFRENHVSHTGLYLHMAMIGHDCPSYDGPQPKEGNDVVDLTRIGEKPLCKWTFALLGASSPTSLSLRTIWSPIIPFSSFFDRQKDYNISSTEALDFTARLVVLDYHNYIADVTFLSLDLLNI